MQRLFSMFPTGRPGIALVLMRLELALLLAGNASPLLAARGFDWLVTAHAVVGLAFCFGFFTPMAATLLVLIEALAIASPPFSVGLIHVCTILDAVGLALLGPGAYSLDAWCFGRRQIILDRRPGLSED
jgi:heme/copper-type cytochrome/quinol oxidase subunit 1